MSHPKYKSTMFHVLLVFPHGHVRFPDFGQGAHFPRWQTSLQLWLPHSRSFPQTLEKIILTTISTTIEKN